MAAAESSFSEEDSFLEIDSSGDEWCSDMENDLLDTSDEATDNVIFDEIVSIGELENNDENRSPNVNETNNNNSAGSSNQNKRRLNDREKEEFLANIKFHIDAGDWQAKKRTMFRSGVWVNICEVFDGETKIDYAYYCTLCKKPIYNDYCDGNTTGLGRHICVKLVDGKKRLIVRSDIKNDLKQAAANFVSKDLRPYAAIEGEGLLELCAASMRFGQTYKKATEADLYYVLPSRNTVKAAVTKRADDIKVEIRKILARAKEIGGFAITSDAWTDNYRRITYICLVAHCNTITNKVIERHKITLYVNEISELVKSKEVIVKHILEVLGDYGFTEEEVLEFVTFVTDRGANFKYGLESKKFKRLNCYAHLIHNLVKAMFKKTRADAIRKDASKIVSFVKKTSINAQLKSTLKKFSSTRWNGAFDMLSSFHDNFEDLSDLLYQRQRSNPKQRYFDTMSSIDPAHIHSICMFLKQFKILTENIESDDETLSFVWPTHENLKQMLRQDEPDDELSIVGEMKAKGLSYLQSRRADFEPKIAHKIATILNPIFKNLPEASETEKKTILDAIKSEVGLVDQTQVNENQNQTPNSTQLTGKLHPFFHSFCVVQPRQNEPKPSELDSYLEHAITSIDVNATEWWNKNMDRYPNLFRYFARISCIPASSSSGETIFSKAGMIVNSRRSKILPENVNNLIIAGNKIK